MLVPLFPVVRVVEDVKNGARGYIGEEGVHLHHLEGAVRGGFRPYLKLNTIITLWYVSM